MSVLALDLGTTTGWACRSNGVIVSGTISFKPGRYDGGGMRFLRFSKWLDELHDLQQFDVVYFEEVRRHLGVDAAHAYGGFLATLGAWCETHSIPYQGISIGTWKKALTGKGNAGKDEVKAAVMALGHSPKDDNEADAIGVLLVVGST